MNRPPSHTFLRSRRAAIALAAVASVALGAAATAQAQVVFPAPGVMAFNDLPTRVHAGENVTLREVMPLAIFAAQVRFQRQSPSGGWRTIASAPPRPRVFWLHWTVPTSWGASQIAVRFVLESRGQVLALSPSYSISVTAAAQRGSHR